VILLTNANLILARLIKMLFDAASETLTFLMPLLKKKKQDGYADCELIEMPLLVNCICIWMM